MDLHLERHVRHAPERMFELVASLEDYPRFIPNCRAMEVRRDPHGPALLARMTLGFGPITQAYTSRVMLDRAAGTITAKAVDGPFSFLDTRWGFAPEGSGTRISFDASFKISNPLIRAVAEPAFAAKQEEIMTAFGQEADRRFGMVRA